MSSISLMDLYAEAIAHTISLMQDIENGVIPLEGSSEVWRQSMRNLGLIPQENNTGDGTGISEDTLQFFVTELTDLIIAQHNFTRNAIVATTNNIQLLLIDKIDTLYQFLIQDLDILKEDILLYIVSFSQQILTAISEIPAQLVNQINSELNIITEEVRLQADIIKNGMNNQYSALDNAISESNDLIINEIRQLGEMNTGGSSGGDSGGTSAWTSGFIVDLLNVIDTMRMQLVTAIEALELTANVTVEGSGTGTGDGTDSSASLPFGLDAAGIGQLIADLITQNQGTIDNNQGIQNDALAIVMAWGRGEFNNINELENAFNNAGIGGTLFRLLWSVLGGLFLVIGLGNAVSRPYLNNIENLARQDAKDNLIPIGTLIELAIRGLIPTDFLRNQVEKQGYSDQQYGYMELSAKNQLPEPYVRSGFLRDKLTDSQWRESMTKLGYLNSDLDLIKELIENVPPVQDAITFAVREAYDDDLAKELQLDANYDNIKDRFEPILKANGINPTFARLYWRSHWRLPSPTQLYEMHWRGLITYDELLKALEVSDYSPQWTEKLASINEREYTRVDVRRMHQIGLLNEQEVKEAYMRIGYPEERAQGLTDFTLAINGVSEDNTVKNLTTTQVLNLYTSGLQTEQEARDSLTLAGFQPTEINLLLDLATISRNAETLGDITKDNKRRIISSLSKNYVEGILPENYVRTQLSTIGYTPENVDNEMTYLNIERDIVRKENEVDIIFNQYIRYQIDINNASSRLASLNYSGGELANIMSLWNIVREDRKKLPTKSEARDFLDSDNITRDEYENILRGLGIMEQYISFY